MSFATNKDPILSRDSRQLTASVQNDPVRTDLFDFHLPADRIAQVPADPRDQSRLMVLHTGQGRWEHRIFADLPGLLQTGDLLVRNNTRVVPARLIGHRLATGGKWEGLFLEAEPEGTWLILATTRGRPREGEEIQVTDSLRLTLEKRLEAGRWRVRPNSDEPVFDLLDRHGSVPLPPYIRKGREGPGDRDRYQTVYAESPGSVAAPTAGLHFTPEVIDRLRSQGISTLDLTLHVGLGTFRPIEAEHIDDHALHAEWAELAPEAASRLNQQRERGGRVIAVGTTSARTLETAARGGRYEPFAGQTALYLKPGHNFLGLDALITNFHLPRSSLLVLVAALAGRELMLAAYQEAIAQGYRFYSYGDAMLILP